MSTRSRVDNGRFVARRKTLVHVRDVGNEPPLRMKYNLSIRVDEEKRDEGAGGNDGQFVRSRIEPKDRGAREILPSDQSGSVGFEVVVKAIGDHQAEKHVLQVLVGVGTLHRESHRELGMRIAVFRERVRKMNEFGEDGGSEELEGRKEFDPIALRDECGKLGNRIIGRAFDVQLGWSRRKNQRNLNGLLVTNMEDELDEEFLRESYEGQDRTRVSAANLGGEVMKAVPFIFLALCESTGRHWSLGRE